MTKANEILWQIQGISANNSEYYVLDCNLLSTFAVIVAVIPAIILLKERTEKKQLRFVVSYTIVRSS